MFKKPFVKKSQTAMRASDQRKLLSSLALEFPALDIAANRLALVPTGCTWVAWKIQTASAEDGIVYAADGQPLFVKLGGIVPKTEVVIPTVYALAKVPGLLGNPVITHASVVHQYLLKGADLMLPGLHRSLVCIYRELGVCLLSLLSSLLSPPFL
jgi:predicted ribosome-associated RNA-binding protein Tma20